MNDTARIHPRPAPPPTPDRVRLLVTAGPTREPIDDVRYLGNRSSGRTGIALAAAAARRGHPTTLLLGPTPLPPPEATGLEVVRFQTAAELRAALADLWPRHDVLIMAAAVADYRPSAVALASSRAAAPRTAAEGGRGRKIPRTGRALTLRLEPTPDLLAEAAARSGPDQTVIGFALEPADRLERSAREKLDRKRIHAIVANPLETMEAETITATVHLRSGEVLTAPPKLPKAEFAEWLLDQLGRIR